MDGIRSDGGGREMAHEPAVDVRDVAARPVHVVFYVDGGLPQKQRHVARQVGLLEHHELRAHRS